MAFSLLIDEVEYICNVFKNSVVITEAPRSNGATMVGRIQLSGALARPVGGMLVEFWNGTRLEFAGRIATVEEDDQAGPLNLQFVIECVDFTPDFDRHMLQATYPSDTITETAHSIVGDVGLGFTSTAVAAGPVIPEVEADLEYPSSLLTTISEQVEHQWYIDYNRNLNLFYVRDRPAPVASIDFDVDFTSEGDLYITEDVSQIKNVIFLTGARVKSANNDVAYFTADGETRFFPLNYAPWALEDVSVEVDNVSYELRLDTIEGQAGDGTSDAGVVYVCLDNWGVRFPDNAPPGDLSDIVITYKYEYETVVRVEDIASIIYMKARENTDAAPSDGVHEAKFEFPELRVADANTIIDYGNLLLSRYAWPNYVLTFTSLTQGWFVGQNFLASSTRRNFTERTVYVTQITKKLYEVAGDYRMQYQITATTSPFPA